MQVYQNPIIPGFNPDPSICRVNDDFYIVTSTFEFFPGVPVYHSKNMVNWTLIDHCLTREEQLPLKDCYPSSGIYAPTIRYHKGIFYMTTTNASSIRNFIVYKKESEKEWSDPVLVAQTGIDPSLFFDDDDKVYYTSTGWDAVNQNYIQMCEINPLTGEMLTDSKIISSGCGGCYPEAPHIYKKGEYYYLMLAEGGSEYGHHETIQRSKNIWGPYDPCPHNPILFHQTRLGRSPIQAAGHADLVEDQNGSWWAVCLGIRPLPYGLLHNLGRETFLSPVKWVDGWPVIGDNGFISLEMEGDLPLPPAEPNHDFYDDFTGDSLHKQWTMIRNPDKNSVRLNTEQGTLSLEGEIPLSMPNSSPAFAGVRQFSFDMLAETKLKGPLSQGQYAGITAFYGYNYHYEIGLENDNGEYCITVHRRVHDLECDVYKEPIQYTGEIILQISSTAEHYSFSYVNNGEKVETARGSVAGLCTEGTERMSFTGTFIGLYSTGGKAYFDWFRMKKTSFKKNYE